MVDLTVKIITLDGTTYRKSIELEDGFIISKNNDKYQNIIQKIVDESKLEEIDDIKITIKMEW